MKIAVFHELPYGGARFAMSEFCKELKKTHILDIYYVDSQQETGIDTVFRNINFFKFTDKNWTGKNWKTKIYKDTIELYRLYKLHKYIARLINKNKYDFIFVHGSKFTQAPFILRFLTTRSVYYCQEPLRFVYDDYFDITPDLSLERKIYEKNNRRIRKLIDRTNIRHANIILANSKFTQSNIKKLYALNATVCYMGIDTSRFHPIPIAKIYDILFIGSKEAVDGYSLLMKALDKMNKRPSVKFLLREEKRISEKQLVMLYSSSRIYIGLGYQEPFGLSPLEAQACGIPVIALNEGGYKETINNSTGLLVERDAEMLARSIAKLLKDSKLIRKLGRNGQKNIKKNWTWKRSCQQLEKIVYNYHVS